jgi:hypothetical protein
MKKDETFAWVVEHPSHGTAKKRSVWDRLGFRSRRDDDDDDDHDLPGPNAGATLWPSLSQIRPRKSAAAFA